MRFQAFKAGNTLLEYCLIGGLVGLVCIPSILTFAQSFQSALLATAGSASTDASSAAEPPEPGGETPDLVPQAGFSRLTFKLDNGKTISLSHYPTNASQAIETLGSNGYTKTLANSIIQLANQLLAAGAITQAQSNSLINLANQGHQIARVAALLDDAARNAGSIAEYRATQVMYKGVVYNVVDLSNFFLDNKSYQMTNVSDILTLQDATVVSGEETNRFVELARAAQADGSLDIPQVREIVLNLSYQILRTAGELDAKSRFDANSQTLGELQQAIATGVQSSHVNSSGVCSAGKGQDNGIYCSG